MLGAWDDGGQGSEAAGPDRIVRLPWFSYSAEGRRLLADLAALIEVFDWMAWARTPRGAELIRAPEAIEAASLEELRRVITVVVRGDRFTEGNVAGAHERGFLAAIARRAGELAEGGRPGS